MDPGSGPRGPLPQIGVYFLNFVKIRQNFGSGPRFMVVDPGVHYQGPLPSPIFWQDSVHVVVECPLKLLKYPTYMGH